MSASPGPAPSPRRPRRLSFVLPAFAEARNLELVFPRLLAQAPLADEIEVVVVDDHSPDETFAVVREWAARDPRVRGLRLARNAGSHMAILCGLSAASGDAIVVLAADGQDPPEAAERLLEAWRDGAQVVWAVREGRVDTGALTRLTSRLYYALMNRLTSVRLPPTGADFFLADRRVVRALLAIPEHNVSIFALLVSLGFRQAEIRYTKQARLSGRSGWTLRRKMRLLLDSLIGFSTLPLRLATALGFVHAAVGFLYAAALVANRLSGGAVFGAVAVTGWSAMMVVLLVSSGSIMVILGIFGEYLWRALEEVRGRPRFLVEAEVNLETNA
ncbi:MAG: glycosyltransferase family 2 protein [Vicinamibacteria bacterium]